MPPPLGQGMPALPRTPAPRATAAPRQLRGGVVPGKAPLCPAPWGTWAWRTTTSCSGVGT